MLLDSLLVVFRSYIVADEVAQWVKAISTKPGDPISIPWTHFGERENQLLRAVLWPPHAFCCAQKPYTEWDPLLRDFILMRSLLIQKKDTDFSSLIMHSTLL